MPLVAEGESEASDNLGGTVLHLLEHVRVRALPDHLPQSIHYSIESLRTFEDLIHVSDLEIPGDATLLNDPTEVVAKVLPPRVEEEPVAAEAPEGAEAEAGADAPAAEGGAPEAEPEG